MAKYEITFACGHTETVELYGNQDQRFARFAWLEKNGKCSKCYKRERHADAICALLDAGYETLRDGSDKQCAWAESLRVDLLNGKSSNYLDLQSVDAIVAALTAANYQGTFEDADAAKKSAIDYALRNRLDAKWWIDARADKAMQSAVLAEWAAQL